MSNHEATNTHQLDGYYERAAKTLAAEQQTADTIMTDIISDRGTTFPLDPLISDNWIFEVKNTDSQKAFTELAKYGKIKRYNKKYQTTDIVQITVEFDHIVNEDYEPIKIIKQYPWILRVFADALVFIPNT